MIIAPLHHTARRHPLATGLSLATAIVLAALTASCCASARMKSEIALADIPADIGVDGTPIAVVHAHGKQVYTYTAGDWVLKPEAQFENADGLTGTHYAGPTWEAADKSKVVGHKVGDASPSADAIPWLLVQADTHEDAGIFSNVTFIQRIHTTGGQLPTPTPTPKAGDKIEVPYTADYVFYGPGATRHIASH